MYKIGISTMALGGKLPAGDPRWAALNDSFRNRTVEAVDFLDAIYQGYSYAPWFDGRRKAENFICAQHIAVDMDTQDERSAIVTIERNRFFRLYGSIIHETPSHTAIAPKCRVIFLLDEPIKNATGYRLAMQTVYSFFNGADIACIDPARFFFGNAILQQRPDGIVYAGNVLPLDELRRFAKQFNLRQKEAAQQQQAQYVQQRRALSTPEARTKYAQSAFDAEIRALAGTREGGRNHQLNRSAFSLGQLVAAGALDESTVAQTLEQTAAQIGLPPTEVAKTLYSGLRAGKQQPRELH
jgi:hypothetical protein